MQGPGWSIRCIRGRKLWSLTDDHGAPASVDLCLNVTNNPCNIHCILYMTRLDLEFAWRVDLFKPQKADSSLSCYLKPEINVANFPWVGVLTKLVGKYHSFKLTRRPTHPSHRTAPRKTLDFTFFHDAKLTSSIILIIPFNWLGGHPPHLKDLHNASVGDTITRVWSKKSKKNWRNSWSLLTFLTV